MNLLIITQKIEKNGDRWGFFHDWIEEFSKNCENVTVICLYEIKHNLPQNVRVLSLGKEHGRCHLKYLFNFYKYIFEERKNYDVVFVHMNPIYVVLGGLFWRMMAKKITLWYTHKSVTLELRIAEKFVHKIFTASKNSFRLKTKKVKVMGHGINTDNFIINKQEIKIRDNNIFKLISVGRISPSKDYETLIKAIEILNNKNIKVEVDLIGSSPDGQENYLEKLKDLTKQKNIKNINFIGAVPNNEIKNYLYNSDLFVHMSQTGSLDKSSLEAMLCALPLVSNNDSVVNDILGNYKNKLAYAKHDFEGLAQRITELKEMDEEERKKIGENLREIVKKDHDLKNLVVNLVREIKT
jgi:glycosyltransferase involved in cell wall biosynthesis